MEHEINNKDNTETFKNERMAPESENCDVSHAFKKAKYAWQIKGHLNAKHVSLNGEASCNKSKTSESVALSGLTDLEYGDIKDFNRQNVNGIIPSSLSTEKNLDHDDESCEKRNQDDFVNSDSQKHTDMIEFIGNKRKSDLLNLEGGCGQLKRLRNLEEVNGRNEINNCSANAHSQQDTFVNLQAEIASAASNPHFRRAVSSILPNFQAFDIPSFIWQKQEMGCAIVDNVFNRTLEEMGLSPDPVVNMSATTRLTVENQSIESAIRNQGLRANNSQSDHETILRNMEEMRQTATRTDFEHTQSQLSRILASQSNLQTLHTSSMAENFFEEEDFAMNDQVLDVVKNKESTMTSNCELSVTCMGDIKLETASKTSVPENDKNNLEESKIEYKDTCSSRDHEKNHVSCDFKEIVGPTNEKGDFVLMEENIPCQDIVEKSSENVLDLAVSTAIMNQGLTFE